MKKDTEPRIVTAAVGPYASPLEYKERKHTFSGKDFGLAVAPERKIEDVVVSSLVSCPCFVHGEQQLITASFQASELPCTNKPLRNVHGTARLGCGCIVPIMLRAV